MEFHDSDPIYRQISRIVEQRIIAGEWKAGDRLPSVRDLAVDLEVNPNTVARTFQTLADDGLIENRRGIGSFVAEGAREAAVHAARHRMEAVELPRLFRSLALLDYRPEDLARLYAGTLNSPKESSS